MINLKSTTLYSFCFNDNPELLDRIVRVMNYMRGIAVFYSATLFTYKRPERCVNADLVQMPCLDMMNMGIFQNKIIPKFIQSIYAMCVHEDGFVINPALWSEEFLDYDFIGSPWLDGIVGNHGFCIESRRCMDARMQLPFMFDRNSDEWFCRDHRALMKAMGMKFAPTKVAARFATELTNQEDPSFGFHGRRYAQAKYELGWKLISEWENQ